MGRILPSGAAFRSPTERKAIEFARQTGLPVAEIAGAVRLAEQIGGSQAVFGLLRGIGKGVGLGAEALAGLFPETPERPPVPAFPSVPGQPAAAEPAAAGGAPPALGAMGAPVDPEVLAEALADIPVQDREMLMAVEGMLRDGEPPEDIVRQLTDGGVQQDAARQLVEVAAGLVTAGMSAAGVQAEAPAAMQPAPAAPPAPPPPDPAKVRAEATRLAADFLRRGGSGAEAIEALVAQGTPPGVAQAVVQAAQQQAGAPELESPAGAAEAILAGESPEALARRMVRLGLDPEAAQGVVNDALTQIRQAGRPPAFEVPDFLDPDQQAVADRLAAGERGSLIVRDLLAQDVPKEEAIATVQAVQDRIAEARFGVAPPSAPPEPGETASIEDLVGLARQADTPDKQATVLRMAAAHAPPRTLNDLLFPEARRLRAAKEMVDLFPREPTGRIPVDLAIERAKAQIERQGAITREEETTRETRVRRTAAQAAETEQKTREREATEELRKKLLAAKLRKLNEENRRLIAGVVDVQDRIRIVREAITTERDGLLSLARGLRLQRPRFFSPGAAFEVEDVSRALREEAGLAEKVVAEGLRDWIILRASGPVSIADIEEGIARAEGGVVALNARIADLARVQDEAEFERFLGEEGPVLPETSILPAPR